MIICLGLFLVPKESLWSKTSLENCCTSTEMSDCCKTDGNSTHDKSKDGKHCDDDCCSTCVSCFHVIASVDHKNSFIDIPFINEDLKEYSYTQPIFSNSLKEIWQPPKLG